MAVRVITDSASGLSASDLEALAITVVPLLVRHGETVRPETEIGADELRSMLAEPHDSSGTSQPSPEDFEAAFRRAAAGGDDVLAVLISGKMSGTMHSAELAAQTMAESASRPRVEVLDSESNSMQEGFAVLAAAEAAARGASLEECRNAARATIRRTRFLFTPRTLEYLKRGGRISAASALAGSLLRIAPVLTAENGAAAVAATVRTHARALDTIVSRMKTDVERCGLRRVAVQAVLEREEATIFARERIEPIVGLPVPVLPIGPTVGLHVGPAIGVVYETIEPLR